MTTAASRVILSLLVMAGLALTARPAMTTDAPAVPHLRINGTHWLDDSGRVYVPRWVSGLTLLVRTPRQQSVYLDWAARTGFNGVRVFAGALTWAGQTPVSARAALPALLDRAASRGLVVEVTALTDTGTGYDARAHLSAVIDILAGRPGVVLELANEVGHPTQAPALTPAKLREWGRELAAPRRVLWAIGATDAPRMAGDFSTLHIDRVDNLWNHPAGVRAIHAASARLGVPVIDNEPVGADEQDGRKTGRQRINEPAVFLALGALDRASGFGGVHHSQSGLMAALPGPVQQRSAAAYVAGHRAVESALGNERGALQEVGQPLSPLMSVVGLPADRVQMFVTGKQAIVVLVGAPRDSVLHWRDGWRLLRVVMTMRGSDGQRVEIVHARSQ